MTDKRKYVAHINRKGLDATGVTEEHVRRMASALGGSTMFIVEAKHLATTVDSEGNVSLALALQGVEPVPAQHDEMVRQFQRGLYLQRPEQQGQAVLSGTAGQNDEDLDAVTGQMSAAVNRDAEGNVVGIWDGDMDAPLTPVPDVPEGGYCPAPGCDLEDGHDGDHSVPDEED